MDAQAASQVIAQTVDHIGQVIVGKTQVIQLTITALLAQGHVLFEDIPGVGKTTLIKTMAATFAADFNRIQFTPDLLPSDILGVTVYDQHSGRFRFQQGPIFTTFLLADELNRATPRAQAALLQAMAERRVTIDGQTYALPDDFFVLATQNPTEYEGTFPLPEAQLDRFLMRLTIGYPDAASEKQMLLAGQETPALPEALISTAQLQELKKVAATTKIADSLLDYVLALAAATRTQADLALGVSPRGTLALVAAAKAWALVAGRDYVTPEDIQFLVPHVWTHRLIGQPGASLLPQQVLAAIIKATPVPLRGA
ncbi:AAA family ATPase [Lacticaseibacillus sp. GG6-2]